MMDKILMVMGDNHTEQEQYSTWDEAVAGHKKWVKRVEFNG
jgi:hypothetical protein